MTQANGFLRKSVPTIVALAIAFGVGAIIMAVLGINPIKAYVLIITGAFGTRYLVSQVLTILTPLVLSALGVMLAFKSGYWSVGSEGQIYLGTLGAVFAGFHFTGLPPIIHIPLVLAFGAATGASWAFLPALLRVMLGVNEILTTWFMNFIAVWLVDYAVFNLWRLTMMSIPMTYEILPSARLPLLVPRTDLSVGFIFAIILVILFYIAMNRTSFGFQVKATGINVRAANAAGINTKRIMFTTAVLSGAMAGLAGAVEVSGVHYAVKLGITDMYGYASISVSALASLNPAWVVPSALLFSVLWSGGRTNLSAIGLPFQAMYMYLGLVIVTVIMKEWIGYQLDKPSIIGRIFLAKRRK